MTEIERAIKYWEKFKQESVEMIAKGKDRNDILAKQVPMCDIALVALREQAERENSKPLTLDELRQMEGEPVWCEYINLRGERRGGKWCICEVIYGNIQPMADYAVGGTDTSTLCYGKTWLAYRAKPERSEG